MNTLKANSNDAGLKCFSRQICFVWLPLILLFSQVAQSAPLVADPKFTSLSTKNGLSQDSVNAMAFDQNGFLWIATEGGLNRFDGYRLNQVKGPNDELNELAIFKIFFDSRQDLWISTSGSGVYRYDLANNVLKHVVSIPLTGHPNWLQYANNFYEDEQGNVLISMDESVLRYSPDTETYTTIYNLSAQEVENNQVIRFVMQIDSVVFIAHSSGLSAIDLNSPNRINLDYLGDIAANIDNVNVKYLLADKQNRLWIGTVQGLYQYPLDEIVGFVKGEIPKPAAKRIIEKRNIWTVKQVLPDHFVIGSDIGLLHLNTENNEFSHILEPNNGAQELSQKDIYDIVLDKAGNFWLGTNYGGALYWSPNSLKFESIFNNRLDPDNRPLSHNTIWALAQTDKDHIWVGTDNGLNYLNLLSKTSEKYIVSEDNSYAFTDSSINIILPAQNGNLWLQTALGLRLFSPEKGTLIPIPNLNELAKNILLEPVYGSRLDNSGNLWFSNGLNFYRLNPTTGVIEEINSLNKEFTAEKNGVLLGTISPDSDDMLAGIHNSLWLIDSNTKRAKRLHIVPEELREQQIVPSSWVIGDNGIMWVAYPGLGIFGLDVKTLEQLYFFNIDNILNTNTVYGLLLDEQQNLWFSSHSGIHRYSTRLNTVSQFRYGQELSTAEFNDGAYLRLLDGRLAYGSPKGITLFDPNTIPDNLELNGKLAITEVSLSSRDISLPMVDLTGKTIELEHDDVGLTIIFSNMAYSAQPSTTYHYSLTEGNNVVAEANTRVPKVTFPTLAPGNYRFEVNTTDKRRADSAAISIISHYAVWSSPLAISLYVLLVLSLIIAWRYFRIQQRRRLDTEKRKVRLFGNAFSHTRDWVVIYDHNFLPIAANKAFEQAFGIEPGEDLNKQLIQVYELQPELQHQVFDNMRALKPGSFNKQEVQIVNNQGKRRDVVMNVSAISNIKVVTDIDYFLFVITDVTEQKNAERQLIKIANYDSLTGLVNRSLFMDRLEHATTRVRKKSVTHAVLFIDLDRFKSVNDSLGHDYGDKLLQSVAKRMLRITSANDTVARMGGDEFVILIEDVEQPDHLIDFINILIQSLESPISIDNEVLRISCSVGISLYPTDGTNAQDLLKQADVAMYSAKKDSLVGFKYFTEELNSKAQQRLLLENQIKRVHQENGFENYYQPIVDIKKGKVAGFELLLRCNVDGQSISPYHFIPVAEELRLIIEMTRDAIERGLRDLQSWYSKGFDGYLSVNLSALHFKSTFETEGLLQVLEKYGLPVSALRFEITESALMENTEEALQKFEMLAEAGFMLALDDFGTGYSSLSYLKRFPLQILKIDKSFVDDIGKDKDSDAIVLTTLGMAKNLNMICVAEGIESEEQVAFFRKHRCRYIQGYFYSRPVAAKFVGDLLDKQWPTE